jgi:ribosomal protein S18 acetylase RimI-like enzyme
VARTIDRALAGEHGLIRELSDRIEALPWGFAFFDDAVRGVYHANAVQVTAAEGVSGPEVIDVAERLLAGLAYRRVVVEHEAVLDQVAPAFLQAGWRRRTEIFMEHRREPDRIAVPESVVEIGFEELAASEDTFIAMEPWGGDHHVRAEFIHRNRRASHAGRERIFAAMDEGAPVGWAKLRALEGGVMQIEDVAVLQHARGLGLGRGVVTAALQAGRAESPPLLFIIADEDDWPKELYARLGFDAIGRVGVFERLP